MPFGITIKSKPPKFKGDLPTHNVTVRGPVHLFNSRIENWLFLQGLNRLGSEGGMETWSTRYSIGAPALYMAAHLSWKHGATMQADLRRTLRDAVGQYSPQDGLEHFVGASVTRAAGDAPLKISAGSRDFVANCSSGNVERIKLLEGAGWIPLPKVSGRLAAAFGDRPYFARDPLIASNLEFQMTDAVRAQMADRLKVFRRNISRSRSQEAPEGFSVPAPADLQYLDFQKGGIAQIVESGQSGIIADDMGLGKTIQGIGIMNGKPAMRRGLVTCQANMKLKWVQEIEKWLINPLGLTVGYAEGDNFPETDIVVINYDIAARHAEKIHGTRWDVVLADEAHNMKNEEAQRTQAILGDVAADPAELDPQTMVPLAEGGQLVHLTGTPKPNRVAELWPLLSSSRPDLWGRGKEARQLFLMRYEPPTLIKRKITKGRREYEITIPLPGKPVRELELQMRLRGSGSFIRRMKRDTPLPPKFRTPIPMPYLLSEEDLLQLKQVEVDFEALMHSARRQGAAMLPGARRQATELIDTVSGLAPGGVQFQEMARVRKNLGVLKAPLAAHFIVDELEQDNDLPEDLRRKTVVFAHHKEVIAIIAAHAERQMPGSVLVYDGSVSSAKKRQDRIDSFQDDPRKRLIIISLAGATGITLTAACRMRVVEQDWSPSNMLQIEDRIWRIGQEQSCDIGYLFVPGSLDITVGMSLIRKMETDERAINTMTLRGMNARKEPALNRGPVDGVLDGDFARPVDRETRVVEAELAQPMLPF